WALFVLIKGMNSLKRKEADTPPPPAPPTKTEVLLEEIRDLLKQRWRKLTALVGALLGRSKPHGRPPTSRVWSGPASAGKKEKAGRKKPPAWRVRRRFSRPQEHKVSRG